MWLTVCVGGCNPAASKSNEVLRGLGPDIQWKESHVADDEMFCVYLATDGEIDRKHAELSGFPATRVTEVGKGMTPRQASRRP